MSQLLLVKHLKDPAEARRRLPGVPVPKQPRVVGQEESQCPLS